MFERAAILGLFLVAVPVLHAGEVLDGIAVTVNGHVILQSDWQDEVRYECFVAGCALQNVTPQDRKAALDRLIDQELLREQASTSDSTQPGGTEEVEKQFYPTKQPEDGRTPPGGGVVCDTPPGYTGLRALVCVRHVLCRTDHYLRRRRDPGRQQ